MRTIEMREPLAATLGALGDADSLTYTFDDVVKLAGHGCPTTASAFVGCGVALAALYPGETPVRGGLEVTVYGAAEEGSLGVIAQVFTLLTGAAPSTGFKGLGPRYRRKDLLRFDPARPDPTAVCVRLRRVDTGKAVLLKLRPGRFPYAPEKAARIGELVERVVWEAATKEEAAELRRLWMNKVNSMLTDEVSLREWIEIEEVSHA